MSAKQNLNEKIKDVAKRIKTARESVGIGIDEAASELGMTVSEYKKYEDGQIDFSFTFIYKIAKLCNVEITDIMEGQSPILSTYTVTRKGEGTPIVRRKGFEYRLMSAPRVASLFSGIGGIDLGFLQSGYEIVFATEIDRDACNTYRVNFPNHYLLERDIRKVKPEEIPDFDVLVAGFPCQAFSIAGKQRGFEDKRGSLFFEIERIVRTKKPRVILLENVKNLQEHDNGKTFNRIFASLAQFGYTVRYKILCPTVYANIPQRRERIFIIAFLDEVAGELFKFPEPIDLSQRLIDIIDFSKRHNDIYYLDAKSDDYSLLKSKIKDREQMYQLHFGQVRKGKDGICRTLTASMGGMKLHKPIIYDEFGIRYLSPQECLLLQGFPSNFVFSKGITLDKAYTLAGNTVCVPLIERIANCIKETLIKEK